MRARSAFLPLCAATSGLLLFIPTVFANMDMFESFRKRLKALRSTHEISAGQYDNIVDDLVANDDILDLSMEDKSMDMGSTRPSLSGDQTNTFLHWISEEMAGDRLSFETADLLRNLFNLYLPSEVTSQTDVPNGPAPANYEGNGIVALYSHSNFDPPFWRWHYNGIWGYATGDREYALQCNSKGLHIVDVTTSDIVLVQSIPMEGGITWRDVATHLNYAYVGAQSFGGEAFVINLENLSGSAAHDHRSNPIPPEHIKMLPGYAEYGHTVNVDKGLLFLNTAKFDIGCAILDIAGDPWNPVELVASTIRINPSEGLKFGDCHDSFVQTIGGRDFLISSEGRKKKWTFSDITDIRTDSKDIKVSSETPFLDIRMYAHQGVVSEDGKTLFGFDEFNDFDIAAYDISNPANPTLIRTFQWSGDAEEDAIVHNGFVRGDYLFVAYYEAGLRVFDISDIHNGVRQVGHYETYRDHDGDGKFEHEFGEKPVYWGAWNLYVGLPSGKILVSDRKYGTFVMTLVGGHDGTPSAYPSGNPTASNAPSKILSLAPTPCYEDAKALFLKGKKSKPCRWLGKKTNVKFCTKLFKATPELLPPLEICPVTCGSCDPYYEHKKSKFFMKEKQNKIISKTCKWLATSKDKNKICKKNTDSKGGYGPPRQVCPMTCTADTQGPSKVPSIAPSLSNAPSATTWYNFNRLKPLKRRSAVFDDVERFVFRVPCGFPQPFFRLGLFGHYGENTAIEFFHKKREDPREGPYRAAIFCPEGGDKDWWGGKRTEFSLEKVCHYTMKEFEIRIERNDKYLTITAVGKGRDGKYMESSYHVDWDETDGNCPYATTEVEAKTEAYSKELYISSPGF